MQHVSACITVIRCYNNETLKGTLSARVRSTIECDLVLYNENIHFKTMPYF
jgi:hypothetical protein